MALAEIFYRGQGDNGVEPSTLARLSTPEPTNVPRWSSDSTLDNQMSSYLSQAAPQEPQKPVYATTVTNRLTPLLTNSEQPAPYLSQWRDNAIANQQAQDQYAQDMRNYQREQRSYNNSVSNITPTGGLGMSAYGFHGRTGMNAQRGSAPHGFQPQMWSALQAAFAGMRAAGLGTPGITDGWRSYAAQVDVRRRKPNLAARPGTSIHGLGLAADLNLNSAQQRWLNANSGRYGLVRLNSEPWHFQLAPRVWRGRW